MAMQDGEDVQRAEKVGLKRKLTGPPRLLLGKTRTRSVGEDRPEARTNKTENSGGDKFSPRAELTETTNIDVVNIKSTKGHREAAEDDDDVSNRKGNRRRWWRRFSPVVVCNRKQKKDINKGSAKQQSGVLVLPEGTLNETDTEGKMINVRKRRFNMTTWPTFKRFLPLSGTQQTHNKRRNGDDERPLTFRKKLHSFFTKGGKSRSSGVSLEKTEDMMKSEEAPCSSAAQVDEPTDAQSNGTVGSPEVVKVTVEERAAESPDETEVSITEEDVTDAGRFETIQSDTNKVPHPPKVFGNQLSETTPQSLQASTNGPSIRIELVPPDNDEDEEEEHSSSENQNHHLLLLIGFEHSEQQLVQTARSLVRAAMNAAVDQLTREQLSDADCVHREPPGCRDHA